MSGLAEHSQPCARPCAHQVAIVEANDELAERTWRLRLRCPEVARQCHPGQFFMVRLPGRTDPLLGRPFALYDTHGQAGGWTDLEIVHLVVGKVTTLLSGLRAGDAVEIWGPLGSRFPAIPEHVRRVTLVAGGIGQTPFLAYTRELLGDRGFGGLPAHRVADRVELVYGARRASLLAGLDAFSEAGAQVVACTEDGSVGLRGRVTDGLGKLEKPEWIVACGPEPMLHAVARWAREHAVPCHVSLETPMACGLGICFSCVVKVAASDQPAGWDYQRVCIEGPTFDAATLVDLHD
ncbi:MAG: dihydroorotate dehydrogenase electron transfer subunit [Planctomycetota bacterium]|nr:dihydroorotate dehydrogenase electron transfer subunit [Planctomycetota bacterium]